MTDNPLLINCVWMCMLLQAHCCQITNPHRSKPVAIQHRRPTISCSHIAVCKEHCYNNYYSRIIINIIINGITVIHSPLHWEFCTPKKAHSEYILSTYHCQKKVPVTSHTIPESEYHLVLQYWKPNGGSLEPSDLFWVSVKGDW